MGNEVPEVEKKLGAQLQANPNLNLLELDRRAPNSPAVEPTDSRSTERNRTADAGETEIPAPDDFRSKQKYGTREWAKYVVQNHESYKTMLDDYWKDLVEKQARLQEEYEKKGPGQTQSVEPFLRHPLELIDEKLNSDLKEGDPRKIQTGEVAEFKVHRFLTSADTAAERAKFEKGLNDIARELGYDKARLIVGGHGSGADKAGHDGVIEFQRAGETNLMPIDFSAREKEGRPLVITVSNRDFDGKSMSSTSIDRMLGEIREIASDPGAICEKPKPDPKTGRSIYDDAFSSRSLTESKEGAQKWGEYLMQQGKPGSVLHEEGKRITAPDADWKKFFHAMEVENKVLAGQDLYDANRILAGKPCIPEFAKRRLAATLDELIERASGQLKSTGTNDSLKAAQDLRKRMNSSETEVREKAYVELDRMMNPDKYKNGSTAAPIDKYTEVERLLQRRITKLKEQEAPSEKVEALERKLARLKNPATREVEGEKYLQELERIRERKAAKSKDAEVTQYSDPIPRDVKSDVKPDDLVAKRLDVKAEELESRSQNTDKAPLTSRELEQGLEKEIEKLHKEGQADKVELLRGELERLRDPIRQGEFVAEMESMFEGKGRSIAGKFGRAAGVAYLMESIVAILDN